MEVLLADQKPNICYGLAVLLGEQPDLEIMGDVDNSDDLLLEIRKKCPDLILLEWGLPGLLMTDLMAEIRIICPGIRVIALSEKENLRETAFSSGVDAFMRKGDPPEKLLILLRDIQISIEQDNLSSYTSEIRYSSDIEIQ